MTHRSPIRLLLAGGLCAATLAAFGSSTTIAQEGNSATGFRFPANPGSWVNSQPFTRKQLEGKVAAVEVVTLTPMRCVLRTAVVRALIIRAAVAAAHYGRK